MKIQHHKIIGNQNVGEILSFDDEDFASKLNDNLLEEKDEGDVVVGEITAIENKLVTIYIRGCKSSGILSIEEFKKDEYGVAVGAQVQVCIVKKEGRDGSIVLSRNRAILESSWLTFSEFFARGESVSGRIFGQVKAGFAVLIQAGSAKLVAFLPGSQADVRPVDGSFYHRVKGKEMMVRIIKMDRDHGNVVVSRRVIMEEILKEERIKALAIIRDGMILNGIVKSIVPYGAFIDLGEYGDGLLHLTDISWEKIPHPSAILVVGQEIKVMVIKYNAESSRISVGLKQLQFNPWTDFVSKYTPGSKHNGVITRIEEYGVFVLLETNPQINGLVYHTEVSWTARNIKPGLILQLGQVVQVMVLEMDQEKHRMSLSIKRCLPNAWELFAEKYPVGTKITVIVLNVTEFGLFVAEESDARRIAPLQMLIPSPELSYHESTEKSLSRYKNGDKIECIIINTDPARERITGSVKQLDNDAVIARSKKLIEADSVVATILDIKRDGVILQIDGNISVFMENTELSQHKEEQRSHNLAVGDKIDVKVVSFNPDNREYKVSVRTLQKAQEDALVKAQQGSSVSALKDFMQQQGGENFS